MIRANLGASPTDCLTQFASRAKQDTEYAAAFREYGVDVEALSPAEAAKRIGALPIAAELARMLDSWTWNRRNRPRPDPLAVKRLADVVQAIDTDPWRNRFRAAIAREYREKDQALIEFKALAAEADAKKPRNSGLITRELHRLGQFGAALALLRGQQRALPGVYWINLDLADALLASDLRNLDEVICYCTAAVAIKPDGSAARSRLGHALLLRGRPVEAEANLREAIRLNPRYVFLARAWLGDALRAQQKWAEARVEYEEAIRLDPDYADAYWFLGEVLNHEADYGGSLAMYRKAHELGSKRPGWSRPSAEGVAKAQRAAVLATRLAAVLNGDEAPKDAAERLAFAQMAYDTTRFVASSRLFGEALLEQPGLSDDRKTLHAYNAACAAALAGCGRGKDDPAPDAETKSRLRRQALDWLKAELVAWNRALEPASAEQRKFVALRVRHWKEDQDLSGIRDAAELAKLPEAERESFRALWAEVDGLLARAEGGKATP